MPRTAPAVVAAVVAVLAATGGIIASCGGDDGGGGGDDGGGGTGSGEVVPRIGPTTGGLVDIDGVTCTREGDQLLADGIVRNRGDNPQYVSIAVRFVDGDDVRVELVSDSVTDLQTGESARWDVSIYASTADSVVACDVTASAS